VTIIYSAHAEGLIRAELRTITEIGYPGDAAGWLSNLMERIGILADFPESGRLARVNALANKGIRQLPIGKYVAHYTIDGKACNIISLRHGAMNIKSPNDL